MAKKILNIIILVLVLCLVGWGIKRLMSPKTASGNADVQASISSGNNA